MIFMIGDFWAMMGVWMGMVEKCPTWFERDIRDLETQK